MEKKINVCDSNNKNNKTKTIKTKKKSISFLFFPFQILTHTYYCLVMVDQAPNKEKSYKRRALYSLSAADKTLCVQSSSTPLSRKLNCGDCSGDLANPEYDGVSKDKDGRFERGSAEEEPSRDG